MYFLGLISLLLFAQSTFGSQLANSFFDDSFAGIYRLSTFDWALLLPYFGILLVLSVYGIHRYETVRRYIRYGKSLPSTAPQRYQQLPRVTVQLPIFNERFVVERLLEETSLARVSTRTAADPGARRFDR